MNHMVPFQSPRLDAAFARLTAAYVRARLSGEIPDRQTTADPGLGVLARQLQRGTRAAANGVRKGDIVVAINGVEVDTVSEVERITARQSRGGWQVVLERAGRQLAFERNGRFFRQYRL